MKSKKGDAGSKMTLTPGEIIIGIIVLLVFVYFGLNAYEAFFKSEECINKAEWGELSSIFEKLEAQEAVSKEVLFNNGGDNGCKLVSFSKDPSLNTIPETLYRGKQVPSGTTICLCNMNNNICNAEKCYVFENTKAIGSSTGGQLNTVTMGSLVHLKFQKSGGNLMIHSLNPQNIQQLSYTKDSKYQNIDEGMIQSLNLKIFGESASVVSSAFVPYVIIDSSGTYPSGIPITTPPDPIKMEITLAALEGETTSANILSGNYDFIKPDFIESSELEFNIPESFATESTTLTLYFKKDLNWAQKNMDCEKKPQGLICSTSFDSFPTEYIIST